MSTIELLVIRHRGRGVAIPAEPVLAVRDPVPGEDAYDLDSVLAVGGPDATARAIEVRIPGGALTATMGGVLELRSAVADDCYAVPKILRSAGCPSWLVGFIADRDSGLVIPWVDIATLLVAEHTRRLFFAAPDDVPPSGD